MFSWFVIVWYVSTIYLHLNCLEFSRTILHQPFPKCKLKDNLKIPITNAKRKFILTSLNYKNLQIHKGLIIGT